MFEIGTIVRSLSGRDGHSYYVIVDVEMDRVKIADGKRRKLEKPKAKNRVHLSSTNKKVDLLEFGSNKAIRRMLEPMNLALNAIQR